MEACKQPKLYHHLAKTNFTIERIKDITDTYDK